ncbi:OmpA family protein [Crocinitomicaceae bacterium]|nr:OmpA family protein [Crocinitomicaceae bacterium]
MLKKMSNDERVFFGDFESSFYTDHFIDIKNPQTSLHHIELTGLKRITNAKEVLKINKKKIGAFLEGDYLSSTQLFFDESSVEPFKASLGKFIINEVKVTGLRKIQDTYHGKLKGKIFASNQRGIVPISLFDEPKASNLGFLSNRKGCNFFNNKNEVLSTNNSFTNKLNRGCSPLRKKSENGNGLNESSSLNKSQINNTLQDETSIPASSRSGCLSRNARSVPMSGGGCSPSFGGCSPIGNGCSPLAGGCFSFGSGCSGLFSNLLSLFFLLWLLSFLFKSCEAFSDFLVDSGTSGEENKSEGSGDSNIDDENIDYDSYLDDILTDTLSRSEQTLPNNEDDEIDTQRNEDSDLEDDLIQELENDTIPPEEIENEDDILDFTDRDVIETTDSSQQNIVPRDTNNSAGVLLELPNIEFLTNSMELKPSSKNELNRLAEFLIKNRSLHIIIYGHTDNKGDAYDNKVLSQERANAVVFYLEGVGIDSFRLKAVGKGENEPKYSNRTPEGRAKNRRVEVSIKNIIQNEDEQ